MAVLRKNLTETPTDEASVDRERLNAIGEDDIRRFMQEDGEDPDADLPAYRPVYPAHIVRGQLGFTIEEFARALHVPPATLRNWEQGSVDPAARSLLAIVAGNPKAAFKALEG